MKKPTGNDLNIIASGTVIDGNVKSDGDINLDGRINGKVECGSVFKLGENGVVEGDIFASDAIIAGKITGSITVKNKVTLEKNSKFSGELKCSRLSIDEGAVFEGKSSMGNSESKKTLSSTDKAS